MCVNTPNELYTPTKAITVSFTKEIVLGTFGAVLCQSTNVLTKASGSALCVWSLLSTYKKLLKL